MTRVIVDHGYWRAVWHNALYNMPHRESVRTEKRWEPISGPMSVPEFIKGNTKNKMKYIDGKPHQLIKEKKVVCYGRHAALARIMGYLQKSPKYKGQLHNEWLRTNMNRGSAPKDPKARELLLELAHARGRVAAIRELTKLGIIHRYVI